jgi:hypothetical protein
LLTRVVRLVRGGSEHARLVRVADEARAAHEQRVAELVAEMELAYQQTSLAQQQASLAQQQLLAATRLHEVHLAAALGALEESDDHHHAQLLSARAAIDSVRAVASREADDGRAVIEDMSARLAHAVAVLDEQRAQAASAHERAAAEVARLEQSIVHKSMQLEAHEARVAARIAGARAPRPNARRPKHARRPRASRDVCKCRFHVHA